MAGYEDRFNAMKAAEAAMKTEPKKDWYSDIKVVTKEDQQKAPSKQSQQEAADAAMRRKEEAAPTTKTEMGKKKGGCVKMAKGGSVGSASKRADGIAQRGKTRGKVC